MIDSGDKFDLKTRKLVEVIIVHNSYEFFSHPSNLEMANFRGRKRKRNEKGKIKKM
jgi:hypothetical protein